jgi:hypothetical protein
MVRRVATQTQKSTSRMPVPLRLLVCGTFRQALHTTPFPMLFVGNIFLLPAQRRLAITLDLGYEEHLKGSIPPLRSPHSFCRSSAVSSLVSHLTLMATSRYCHSELASLEAASFLFCLSRFTYIKNSQGLLSNVT